MSKVTEDINRKFNIKKILIAVIVAILVIVAVFFVTYLLGRPCDKTNNTFKEVTIEEGDSTSDIAHKLKESNIIDDESKFIGLSGFLFKNGKYQAGTYLLSPSMDFNRITSTMINGITTNSGFTIPSGYTIDQTFSSLDQANIVDKKELYDVIENVDFSGFDFIDSTVDKNVQLEGFLFPSRYTIATDANAMMIITTMLDKFDNEFNDEFRARTEELGLSIRDIVIIASMIEKTTSVDKEKAAISSVIHNRLNLGIEFKNGYPTDPLCSPSKESIKAALYPEESDNLYYVMSDKLDGSHNFAVTIDEYIALLDKYKTAKKYKEASE